MSLVGMRNFMHKKSLVRYIMLVLAIVLGASTVTYMMGSRNSTNHDEKQTVVGGDVARVGNSVITREDFDKQYRDYLSRMASQMGKGASDETAVTAFEQSIGPYEQDGVRKQVLQQAEQTMLTVEAAKGRGVKISDRDVDQEIDKQVDMALKQQKDALLANSKDKSDKAFAAALSSREPGMTVDAYKSKIHDIYDKHRAEFEQGLYGEKLTDKLKSSVDTSDKAFLASYDTYTFRELTLDTKSHTPAQATQTAKSLVDKLRKGADFAEVAKQNSTDFAKDRGGLIPDVLASYLPSEMSSVLRKQKPGEISDPITTPYGVLIIKLEKKGSKVPPEFKDPKKRKELRDKFVDDAAKKAQSEYIQSVKASTKIEILDPEMKAYEVLTSAAPNSKAGLVRALAVYTKAMGQVKDDIQGLARCYAEVARIDTSLASPAISPKRADQAKYNADAKSALQNALRNTESSELRLMLAQIEVSDKQYKEAVNDLSFVSANAYNDPQSHEQMLKLYETMSSSGYDKAAPLIAEENKWKADYDKQMKEQREAAAMQQAAQHTPRTAPAHPVKPAK